MPQFRFDSKTGELVKRGVKHFSKPSATKQSFKEDCDINSILKRLALTGDEIPPAIGEYIDLTNVPDYQAALDVVANANSLFHELPSSIRDRFGNDPGKFLHFVEDPKNAPHLVDMGLAPNPPPVVPAAPAAPAEPSPSKKLKAKQMELPNSED